MHNLCIKRTLTEFVILTGHGICVFNLPFLCTLSVIRIIQYTIIVSSDRIDTLKEFDKKGLHTRYTRDTQIDIVLTGHFCLGLYKKTVYVKTRLTEYTTIVSSDRFDTP